MTDERLDENGISRRLAEVEKSNRRLKYAVGTVVAAMCLLLLYQTRPRVVAAQDKTNQVIETQELRIKDPEGKTRVQIRANGDAAAVLLYAPNGQRRVTILGAPSSGVTIEGPEGRKIAVLLTNDGPSLGFYDPQDVVRAFLAVTGSGPSVTLYDPKGIARASLLLAKDGPSVNLYDGDGGRGAALGFTTSGSALVFLDSKGQPLASFGAAQSASFLALFDSKGNLVTRLP